MYLFFAYCPSLQTFVVLCRRRDVEDPIEKALGGLGKEEIHVLLEYVREWNTKPKLCHVAQAVLFRMFRIFPPTDIVEVSSCPQKCLRDPKPQPWSSLCDELVIKFCSIYSRHFSGSPKFRFLCCHYLCRLLIS